MKQIQYFTFPELIKTQTGLKNCPKYFWQVQNIIKTAEYLDKIRDMLGAPIIVNSGYRTKEVNQAVKGSANSYHLYGRAADITTSPFRYQELCDILKREKERGNLVELKLYTNYIHIAV